MTFRAALLLASTLFLAPLATSQERAVPLPAPTRFWTLDPVHLGEHVTDAMPEVDMHVDRILEEMTDEQRVAQLLMVSWADAAPTPEIMRWITERNIGGIKVFGWNGEDLPTLARAIGEMQRASLATPTGIPLFTATDQEGGWVRHVKDGTSITPGNMAIGATNLPFDALMTGRYIGLELRALGINMNFAPTVDVYRNPEAHVIGPRAFSSDPTQSGMLGIAFYRGMEEVGVMATAKHFPGHGNATGDSHGILPVISDDWETLWDVDVVPFRMMIRDGVPAVLSGHLSFPDITGVQTPASISSYFKQRVLRDELDFRGVVITDDLYMGGALEYGRMRDWGFEDIVREAIMAGNDIVMLSRTPGFDGSIWQTLIDAYRTDPAFRDRVDESVRRVLRVKLVYLLEDDRVPLVPDVERIREAVRTQDSRAFFLDQAGRSVTRVRGAGLPLTAERAGRVLLVGKYPAYLSIGRRWFPGAATFQLEDAGFYTTSGDDRRQLAAMATGYDTIVFLLSDPGSLGVLNGLEPFADRTVVFSTLTPIYLGDLPWVREAIAVYGWGTESFESGFSVLSGEIPAPGTLPISLPAP